LSLKNDINMVKEELSSEEKFFEKAVVTEKFVKKYKNLIIGSVVVAVLGVGGKIAYDANKAATIASANETLQELQKDASNKEAFKKLQSLSPALADVWSYSQAVVSRDADELKRLQNSKALIVDDLATYEYAQTQNDIALLDSYSLKQGAIYADLAQIQSAVLLINDKKIEEAHQKLATVSENSPLYKVAKVLLHYGVK
jgi:hypothetical protein